MEITRIDENGVHQERDWGQICAGCSSKSAHLLFTIHGQNVCPDCLKKLPEKIQEFLAQAKEHRLAILVKHNIVV